MKVKYLCIIVGIVLAAMLFVGAGAADFYGNEWHVDTKWGLDTSQNYNSALDVPSISDVQSQAGDKEIDSDDFVPILNAVKEIVKKNPVVIILKNYAEYQAGQYQRIGKTIIDELHPVFS